jgi:protein gp37
MAESNIEWTEKTWNPTTGCNKLSTGCKFCYAEVMSHRLKAMGIEKYKNDFKITTHPSALHAPYEWKKPSLIFVNSMSDLFHKDVPFDFIKQVFEVMNNTPLHTYQVLTKRGDVLFKHHEKLNWTENIWMGVSVENDRVTERIDFLRNTNAHVKFLSLEPLLGPLRNLNLDNIDWAVYSG